MIRSGYTGLFRPPFESLDRYGTTIYCVANSDKSVLLMIPLVPGFFNDAFNIIKHCLCKKVYIATPSPDVVFISDIYNLYYEVYHNLGMEFTYLTYYPVTFNITEEFMTHVKVGAHHLIPFEGVQWVNTDPILDFSVKEMPVARYGCDIYLWDSQKKIMFAQYLTERKLTKLCRKKETLFDEIHMPFNTNLYGGLKYNEVRKLAPSILPITRLHSFTTEEEAMYCKDKGYKCGELIII